MSTKETPFCQTYGAKAMLPVEPTIGSLRASYFEETSNYKDAKLSLVLIEERREQSNTFHAAYKSFVERYYNQRVREKAFKI